MIVDPAHKRKQEAVVSAASGDLPWGPGNSSLIMASEIRDAENPALGTKL